MKTKYITIVDYGLSNLESVRAACEYVGLRAKITDKPSDILNSKCIILPGVGAFKTAIDNLKKLNLDQALKQYADSGNYLIGICLGMQLLMTESEEFGNSNGLNIIEGNVKKFAFNDPNLYIPHVGWNKIFIKSNIKDKSLFKNNIDSNMYFVHSYYVDLKNKDLTLAETQYGDKIFCSAFKKDNIYGIQFHPEKSGKKGIEIYKQISNIYYK